jgi:hypothetical protein
VPWTIVTDEPEDVSDFERDASRWLWEIERGEERRQIEVMLTMPSVASDNPLAEVRDARETRGRSALERYLNDDDPPRQILVSTNGISTG